MNLYIYIYIERERQRERERERERESERERERETETETETERERQRLKTLNSQKCSGLCPLKPYQGSAPDLKLQLRSLCNHFFPYKTPCSSTKWTLVKVLG